jgi:hypothetical protein
MVADLSGVADLLVQLAPEAEPPPAFGARVLGAMGHDRRIRRRWIAGVAAVAAAAAITAVVVVRVVDAGNPPRPTAAPLLRSVAMRGADGLRVGRVVTSAGSPASASVTVDYAVPDGDYRLRVRWRDNVTSDIGTILVHQGEGTWTGPVATTEGTATLQMVDRHGQVVCQAKLVI